MPGDDYMDAAICGKCNEHYDVRFGHRCRMVPRSQEQGRPKYTLEQLLDPPPSKPSAVQNTMDLLAKYIPGLRIKKIVVKRGEFVTLMSVLSQYCVNPKETEVEAMTRIPRRITVLGVTFEEEDGATY